MGENAWVGWVFFVEEGLNRLLKIPNRLKFNIISIFTATCVAFNF